MLSSHKTRPKKIKLNKKKVTVLCSRASHERRCHVTVSLSPFLPSSLLSGMEKTEILEVFTIGFCAAQRKVGIL
jgi:hypothetical protein